MVWFRFSFLFLLMLFGMCSCDMTGVECRDAGDCAEGVACFQGWCLDSHEKRAQAASLCALPASLFAKQLKVTIGGAVYYTQIFRRREGFEIIHTSANAKVEVRCHGKIEDVCLFSIQCKLKDEVAQEEKVFSFSWKKEIREEDVFFPKDEKSLCGNEKEVFSGTYELSLSGDKNGKWTFAIGNQQDLDRRHDKSDIQMSFLEESTCPLVAKVGEDLLRIEVRE